MSLRVLVFDLDDTLLDERPGRLAGRAALAATLRESAPHVSQERFAAAYERAATIFWGDERRHRRGRLDLVAARVEIVSAALSEIGHANELDAREASRRYHDAATASHRLMPGALEALECARERVDRLVLLTNGAADPQTAKIGRFDLASWFDHIQIEGVFGLGKPEPEAFRHAVEAVGATVGEALMVGNDFDHDVLGALGAGLEAVWVDVHARGAPAEPPVGLCGTIQDIRQLPKLLGSRG
ncbi:MAG: HAD family hydrolase [Myxococcales bacterium]|nr:HAD family hydrolase [Myxococcales bacterium]